MKKNELALGLNIGLTSKRGYQPRNNNQLPWQDRFKRPGHNLTLQKRPQEDNYERFQIFCFIFGYVWVFMSNVEGIF
jgi:hypothetical protein